MLPLALKDSGPPEVLRLGDVACPLYEGGEALIRHRGSLEKEIGNGDGPLRPLPVLWKLGRVGAYKGLAAGDEDSLIELAGRRRQRRRPEIRAGAAVWSARGWATRHWQVPR